MKKQALQSPINPVQQLSQVGTAPAPVGGWNTRDSIAAMPSTDAIVLDNFYPSSTSVDLRAGSDDWATGFPSRVKTLMSYSSATKQELYGADDTGIFNITAGGAVGAAVSTVTNGYLQHVNFSTAAGSYLISVNGLNKLKLYDGTTWADIDGVSVPAITGLATTDIINVNAFKNRLWFVLKDSLDIWYMPVASIGGAATKFPLGGLFTRGGYLMAMGSWTIDGGSGVDDFAIFVTSQGEIAVYQGTDPASPTTWALVGVYYIGAPIGRRCLTKYGGDLLYLCAQGLFPLSKALQSASIDRTVAMSDKISPTFSASATSFGANLGWQTTVFPDQNMIMVNVPAYVGTASYQYVMNGITQSWCRFTDWNASCFFVWNSKLYFGTEGKVTQAYIGSDDNGAYITGVGCTAYSYLQYVGLKHLKLIRPMLSVNGPYDLYIGANTDFEDDAIYSFILSSTSSTSLWDVGLWDVAVWGGGPTTVSDWDTVAVNPGFAISAKLQIRSKLANIKWLSTDYAYEQGGVL